MTTDDAGQVLGVSDRQIARLRRRKVLTGVKVRRPGTKHDTCWKIDGKSVYAEKRRRAAEAKARTRRAR